MVSPYAIMLRKSQAFAVGARPVLYGLSDDAARAEMRSDGTRRFSSANLPDLEQYRYVAFNAAGDGTLDWTHEREWRWPNSKFSRFKSYDIPEEDSPQYAAWNAWNDAREADRFDGDGLCLDSGDFAGIGFLVKHEKQVKLLTHDILRLVDADVVPKSLFSFILQLDLLPAPETLMTPESVASAIEAATISLEPFFSPDDALGVSEVLAV
jgi:hypothetical protein